MGLATTLIVGGFTLVFGVGGLVFALEGVREAAEAVRVGTGAESVLARGVERDAYLALTVAGESDADGVTLGQVHDTFGYWVTRYWASGPLSIGFTYPAKFVMKVLYGPDQYRDESDRRRGRAFLSESVPVRGDGRRLDISFGRNVWPLQRLEANGSTVPWFVGVGVTILAVLTVFTPLLWMLVTTSPTAALVVGTLLALVVGGPFLGTVYHDTALFGRWESVTDLAETTLPETAVEAGETDDPAQTPKVDCVAPAPDEPLRVVGTVVASDGQLRLSDGVVSTRGRAFLAVAALVDAGRTFAFAGVCLVLAAVGVALLFPSAVAAVG